MSQLRKSRGLNAVSKLFQNEGGISFYIPGKIHTRNDATHRNWKIKIKAGVEEWEFKRGKKITQSHLEWF